MGTAKKQTNKKPKKLPQVLTVNEQNDWEGTPTNAVLHNSFHLQQNHKLWFGFISCAFQIASSQKTAVLLLKATQATRTNLSLNWNKHIKWKASYKKKRKLLKVKIKHQGAFRQVRLPFAENTFPPQELLGSTLKLDPLLHYPRPSSCSHT